MFRRAAVSVLVVAMIIPATLASAPSAVASCASGSPPPSPWAFVGTVIDAKKDGRIATVITDENARVTVLGTDDTGWLSHSESSVDRRYAVGARYEFHPINASDPYRDNACTATRKLAGPALQPLPPRKGFLPGWLPVDEQAGPIGYAMFFVPLIVGILGIAVVARLARRSMARRRSPR